MTNKRTILEEIIEQAMKDIDTCRKGALINEGMIINRENKTVTFDPNSQDNVDTNDYIHPYIIENQYGGCDIVSIFERKENVDPQDKSDGNPVLSAIKGINGWSFENPSRDIPILYRRLIAAVSCLQHKFHTMIMTSSHNELNLKVFERLRGYIKCDYYYEAFFQKIPASTVKEFYMDKNILQLGNDRKSMEKRRKELDMAFDRMERENNGIFSYKFLPEVAYRQGIIQSMTISFGGHTIEEYREAINGKDVLILDDTVSSGKTISDSGEAIREMFVPNRITFLTVFSPRYREHVFSNIRNSTYSR